MDARIRRARRGIYNAAGRSAATREWVIWIVFAFYGLVLLVLGTMEFFLWKVLQEHRGPMAP